MTGREKLIYRILLIIARSLATGDLRDDVRHLSNSIGLYRDPEEATDE